MHKKRADEMLRSAGLQLPLENTFINSDNSIAYSAENVKTYGGNLDNFAKSNIIIPAAENLLSRQ